MSIPEISYLKDLMLFSKCPYAVLSFSTYEEKIDQINASILINAAAGHPGIRLTTTMHSTPEFVEQLKRKGYGVHFNNDYTYIIWSK